MLLCRETSVSLNIEAAALGGLVRNPLRRRACTVKPMGEPCADQLAADPLVFDAADRGVLRAERWLAAWRNGGAGDLIPLPQSCALDRGLPPPFRLFTPPEVSRYNYCADAMSLCRDGASLAGFGIRITPPAA